eukprot:COSAG01_NODE_16058_length_1274_cov_1.088511_1_plen_125_part_00
MVQYELVLRSVYYEYIRCTMRLVVLAGRGYAWRPQLIDPVSYAQLYVQYAATSVSLRVAMLTTQHRARCSHDGSWVVGAVSASQLWLCWHLLRCAHAWLAGAAAARRRPAPSRSCCRDAEVAAV